MSEKVLICSNESQIINVTRAVEECLPYFQAIYIELKKIIESPDLRVIRYIVDERKPKSISELSTAIKQLIVDRMENPTIGGVEVKKDILIDYIEIQDVTPLFNVIAQLRNTSGFTCISGSSTRSYEIEDESLNIFFDFQRVVKERYSYYTQNDKQVCFMEKANAFLAAVNDIKPYIHFPSLLNKLKDIEFLKYNGDGHMPTIDESFVQRIV